MNVEFVEMMVNSLEEGVASLEAALLRNDVKMVHDLKAFILDLQVKINALLTGP